MDCDVLLRTYFELCVAWLCMHAEIAFEVLSDILDKTT
jgi:hypothetical protein